MKLSNSRYFSCHSHSSSTSRNRNGLDWNLVTVTISRQQNQIRRSSPRFTPKVSQTTPDLPQISPTFRREREKKLFDVLVQRERREGERIWEYDERKDRTEVRTFFLSPTLSLSLCLSFSLSLSHTHSLTQSLSQLKWKVYWSWSCSLCYWCLKKKSNFKDIEVSLRKLELNWSLFD